MAQKIRFLARVSIQRNPITGCSTSGRAASTPRQDRPNTRLANGSLAAEPHARHCGTRGNRIVAQESAGSDGNLHNNQADRTRIFFPDDLTDDPRRRPPAEEGKLFAASRAAALASGDTVRAEPHGLARWSGTGLALSTTASDGQRPGRPGCNSGSAHRTAETGSRTPSASSPATRCGRLELESPNDLEHLEVGPRELLSRKVKSRIEAANFNPRR
jgi:hypothetical protein